MTRNKESKSLEYLKSSIHSDFDTDDSLKQQSRAAQLGGSYYTVQMNYDRLMNHFVGRKDTDPVFHSDDGRRTFSIKGMEVKSELDNYLGSVYSYHEHLRSILEDCLDTRINRNDFIAENKNDHRTEYSRKLEIIWGLRVVTQHSEYDGIDTKPVDCNVDGLRYGRLILDVQGFKSYGWDRDGEPGKFLRDIDPSEQINIILKIHKYNEVLEKFNRASVNVLIGEPESPVEESSDFWDDMKSSFNREL